MRVEVNALGAAVADRKGLRRSSVRVMKAEGIRKDAVLSITVTDKDEMRRLNKKYLERDEPTDVLAFSMMEESGEGFLLGDVVICPEFIDEHRRQYHVDAGREVDFVLAHGVLHLLGYDDDDQDGWRRMDSKQRQILGLRGESE